MAIYENDLFISYSHIDNQPFGPDGGWVDIFHAALQNFVNVRVGRRVAVWRDARLSGAEAFSDRIEQELSRSAVLVSIISPGYLRSDWCGRELLHFTAAAEASGQLRIGTLRRVVKVLRLPVARELLPPSLDDALGTSFYRVDAASSRARDLLLDPQPDAQQVFRSRVDDVAHDIAEVLEAIGLVRAEPAAADPPGAVGRRTVFLGWTTSDVTDARDALRRELEARGCAVVPGGAPPLDAAGLNQAIRAAGRDAAVAIYMIGAQYGFIPEGETRSVIEMQYDLATAALGPSAPRIAWIAPIAANSQDARVSGLVTRIKQQGQPGAGWDVLVDQPIETLKAVVLNRLNPAAPPARPASSGGVRSVYLMCDQLDLADATVIRDRLLDRALDVRLPLFDGDAEEIRQDHYETLTQCDAMLLYWGRSSEGWLRTKLRDQKKAFGLGRTNAFRAASIYLAQLPDPKKESFRTLEAETMRAGDAEALDRFVAKVLSQP